MDWHRHLGARTRPTTTGTNRKPRGTAQPVALSPVATSLQSSTTTYFFHHCRTTSTHHFGCNLPPADPAVVHAVIASPNESGVSGDDPRRSLNRARREDLTVDSICRRSRDSQNRSDYTRSASLGAPLSMVSEVASVPWSQPGCLSSGAQLARRFIGSDFTPRR